MVSALRMAATRMKIAILLTTHYHDVCEQKFATARPMIMLLATAKVVKEV